MQTGPVDVRHKLPPLKALTSVRFFAAMYVVLFHDRLQDTLTGVPVAARFIESGYTAVTLFFVLSGFILAYNYPAVKSRKSFWIARFARVYPVYLLATVLMFAVQVMDPYLRQDGSLYAGTLLVLGLVQAWWPRFHFLLNEPAWTLSVEAFFYAAFPFLIGPVSRMRRRTFVGLQVAYLVLVCVPWMMQWMPSMAARGVEWGRLIEDTTPLFRLNTFVVGIYMGARWARLVGRMLAAGESGPWRGGRRSGYLAVGAIGSLALLCTAPSAALRPLRTLLLTYTYALLLAGLASTDWRILTNHWMQVAGEISYGVYILQVPVLHFANAIARRWLPWVRHPEVIQVVLILPVAYVVFRWFEMPARLLIRRVLTGRPVATRAI